MARYTVAEIKAVTSVPGVANFADARILLYQATAEAILASLDLDVAMSGYSNAYDAAVILLFDWIAENPRGARAISAGKTSTTFGVDALPLPVKALLESYQRGTTGVFSGAKFQRTDIGLR